MSAIAWIQRRIFAPLFQIIGCAALLSVPVLFLVFFFAILTRNTLADALLMSTMTGFMFFAAALGLAARDFLCKRGARRRVRRGLLSRTDISDLQFLSQFPTLDGELLLQIRTSIAKYFDVPVGRIYPTDQLPIHFESHTLDPDLPFFVIGNVLWTRKVDPGPYGVATKKLTDFAQVASELTRIIERRPLDPS